MATLILLMQLFGTFGYDVSIIQHEPEMNIAGCDQRYDKGLTVISCIDNTTNKVKLLLATDSYFWELEAAKEIINGQKILQKK